MKISNLIKDLEQIFGGTQQAWWVLENIIGKPEAELIVHEDLELTKEQQNKLDLFIEKTKQHYPLQYLLGSVPFLDLEILVKPPVLIPRPETEEWVGDLIGQIKKVMSEKSPLALSVCCSDSEEKCIEGCGLNILDLCSGSGCIALALAKSFPKSLVYGVDISQVCIDLANKNKIKNKINNVEFINSDLFKDLNKNFKFDLIVANPPYISEEDYKTLQPEVKNWEDKRALVAENNGLEIIEKIISSPKDYLNHKSVIKEVGLAQVYIEIGYNQGEQVKQIFKNNNFSNITIIKDLNKKDRVVSAGV